MDNNYIFQYWEAIQNGTVTVGKWIKTIYEILVNGLKSGKWDFDEEKANKAINFIENFCHHSEGRNDLLKLELWQKAIVSAIFGIMDKRTGYRQFREVFIVVARKNGKTLFAAAIAAYMAYIDGEYGAKVYFLAPKLDQADLVYDAFYQIVQADDELDSITKKRRSDIYIKEFNTSVKKIAFNSKKSDGFNPQMVVNDEMEAWQGDQGLKQYEVMTSALGARKQPLILSISTAGYINDGIYDELMRRSTSFLKGNSKETRILPFLYMIDNIEAWDDLEELKKSNPEPGSVRVRGILHRADRDCKSVPFKESGVSYKVLQHQAKFQCGVVGLLGRYESGKRGLTPYPGAIPGVLLRWRHRPFQDNGLNGGVNRYLEEWKMECDYKILYAKETV